MNENVRMRVLTWLAQDEYFREMLGYDVLFVVDIVLFEDVRGDKDEPQMPGKDSGSTCRRRWRRTSEAGQG